MSILEVDKIRMLISFTNFTIKQKWIDEVIEQFWDSPKRFHPSQLFFIPMWF